MPLETTQPPVRPETGWRSALAQAILLAAAGARGNPVVGGLGMLIHQARPAFKAWFGIDPEATPELRAILEATIK